MGGGWWRRWPLVGVVKLWYGSKGADFWGLVKAQMGLHSELE